MAAIFSQNREERRIKSAIKRINSIQPWFYKQYRFLEDDARHVWQMAASQSGKTEVAVPKFLRRILKAQLKLRKEHGRWIDRPYWIVVPNSKIAMPVKEKMNKYLPRRSGLVDRAAQGQSAAFWSLKDGTGTAFLKNGANITYKSFDQGEGLVAASLGGIWIDECARCDDETVWQNLFARLKETRGWTIGTSSPAAKNSFYTKIYKSYVDDPEHSWLKWTSIDSARSPHSAISMADIERARARMSPHLFAREYMADWSSAEGMVYDTFAHERNVIDELPFAHEPRFIIGLDFGKNHPTAFEVVRFDDREFVAVEELTLESPAFSDIVKATIRFFLRYKPYKIYYDYGGGGAFLGTEWAKIWKGVLNGSKNDAWRLVFGIWCEVHGKNSDDSNTINEFMEVIPNLARKANIALETAYKNVTDGIEMIHTGISSGRIKIASKCEKVIEEIDGYVWKDHQFKDEPVKENDDHLDALRYAIATFSATRLSSSRAKDIFGVAA